MKFMRFKQVVVGGKPREIVVNMAHVQLISPDAVDGGSTLCMADHPDGQSNCLHVTETIDEIGAHEEWAPGDISWRPIDSAPKDGSYILVTNGIFVDTARWSHGSFGGFTKEADATHWMPLPSPPCKPIATI